MKVNRLGDNFTTLEKNQMLKIDELQEKNRLMEFDRSQNNAEINELKRKLKTRTNTINTVIHKLVLMKRRNDYTRISFVISSLKGIYREEDNDKNEI